MWVPAQYGKEMSIDSQSHVQRSQVLEKIETVGDYYNYIYMLTRIK